MNLVPFIAESAADAAAQIRQKLGPQAVVVNVRQLPPEGISRLWKKPQIEVLAYVPDETAAPSASPSNPDPPQHPADSMTHAEQFQPSHRPPTLLNVLDEAPPSPGPAPSFRDYGRWRAGTLLESMGFLPIHAQKVVSRLQMLHGEIPPESLAEEIQLVRYYLKDAWPKSTVKSEVFAHPHVLIGAPGCGKSTVLCKWITHAVLLEQLPAQVLKLDGRTANTADFLSYHCEALGVGLDRTIPKNPSREHVVFVDLPGVNWKDPGALQELAKLIAALPGAELHLVLNAAYDTNVLLAQIRAFGALPITDFIFTHLDEETRWAKLWNFVLGTKFTVRFLSAGQNIPGGFAIPTSEHLFQNVLR